MENVWHLLKDLVAGRQPKNLDELEQCIREEWANLPRDLPGRLMESHAGRDRGYRRLD